MEKNRPAQGERERKKLNKVEPESPFMLLEWTSIVEILFLSKYVHEIKLIIWTDFILKSLLGVPWFYFSYFNKESLIPVVVPEFWIQWDIVAWLYNLNLSTVTLLHLSLPWQHKTTLVRASAWLIFSRLLYKQNLLSDF